MTGADSVFDARGLVVPVGLLGAKKALGGLAPGQVLEVVLQDGEGRAEFEALAERLGHEVVERAERGGLHFLYLRKGAG